MQPVLVLLEVDTLPDKPLEKVPAFLLIFFKGLRNSLFLYFGTLWNSL